MNIARMSEQWVATQIKQKRDSKCIPWKSLRDLILVHPDARKRVEFFALSIYGLYRSRQFIPTTQGLAQCEFAYKCDNFKKKVGLRARVMVLEKSLHQHHSRNSVIELKASLTKIEELKGKIEELEVALQNCELRVELFE
ncbi:hypothetical protein Goarm_021744, partial [Gossypium armourianum]|nr:hypothetical protein [Gossypium armourianum]